MGASFSKETTEVIPDDPDDAPHEPAESEPESEPEELGFLSWGWFI
jgi:hypothetical protein